MSKIEIIGKRISVLKDDEVASFVIKPTDANWKTHLLTVWLVLWTVSGIAVAVNYFSLTNTNYKLVVIMWMSFWAYFEFKIGKESFKNLSEEEVLEITKNNAIKLFNILA